jgi:3-hydroxybutyryl-CoA dehydrogenase
MSALSKEAAVLVVGAGAMGSGIAHVAARAGHVTYLFDQSAEAVARGKAAIEKDLRFLVGKSKLSEADCEATLARLQPIDRLEAAREAQLAIEAIVENLEVKRKLFVELEGLLGESAILATNTSSLSITAIGAALKRPQRLVGMHFFNPAPRMALVEVVSGLATDPTVAAAVYATSKAWGKVPVHAKSTPGFIVNRVARPYYGEALRVLAEGAADVPTLDALMREACGFPMGPFELMDLIGHDVNFSVSKSVFDATFGDPRFTPSLIQQELVLAGRLGRKSGRGFYDYAADAAKPAPCVEEPMPRPASVTVFGDLGVAAPLAERLASAGVSVAHAKGDGVGGLRIGTARLHLSDGRTATRRAAQDGVPDLVVFDLALDFAATPRLAVAHADQCSDEAYRAAVGALQAAGIAVSRLDDVAGLIGLRTVAMLANEAADAVALGIGTPAEIDAAMRYGTNYPRGPLAWADVLGAGAIGTVLGNLLAHYGDPRYRCSPYLQRRRFGGGALVQ